MNRYGIYACLTIISVLNGALGKNLLGHVADFGPSAFDGKDIAPMIVNGEDAPANYVPSMVSLQQVEGDYVYHICGGTLASRDKVVTAAHCLGKWPKVDHYVGLAYQSLEQGPDNPHAQFVKVVKAELHSAYVDSEEAGLPNDIAILTLERKVTLVPGYIQTQTYTTLLPNQLAGSDAYLVGWGQLGKDQDGPDVLQIADFTVLSQNQCTEYYEIGPYNPSRNVCVKGQYGQGDCGGDSGGPLLDYNDVQIGLASYGSDDCDPNYGSIYTSVGYYNSWIQARL